MTDIDLVVTDLDRTLLNDMGLVSEEDYSTLELLGEKNICRIIATGRSLFSFKKVIPNNFPIDYLIFSSGLGIIHWKTKKLIHENILNKKDISSIFTVLNNYDLNFMIQYPIPENHFFFFNRNHSNNHDFERRLRLYLDYSAEISSVKDIDFASQFIAIIPENSKFIDILEKELTGFQIIRATSPIDHKSIWVEILPNNVSKGNTLDYLIELNSLDYSKSIGIGNDYNDLDFLTRTKYSYLVKNAPANIKKEFLKTQSNNENGFSFAVNNHITLRSKNEI